MDTEHDTTPEDRPGNGLCLEVPATSGTNKFAYHQPADRILARGFSLANSVFEFGSNGGFSTFMVKVFQARRGKN